MQPGVNNSAVGGFAAEPTVEDHHRMDLHDARGSMKIQVSCAPCGVCRGMQQIIQRQIQDELRHCVLLLSVFTSSFLFRSKMLEHLCLLQ